MAPLDAQHRRQQTASESVSCHQGHSSLLCPQHLAQRLAQDSSRGGFAERQKKGVHFNSMFVILQLCQTRVGNSEAEGVLGTLFLSLPGTQKTSLSFVGGGGGCFVLCCFHKWTRRCPSQTSSVQSEVPGVAAQVQAPARCVPL